MQPVQMALATSVLLQFSCSLGSTVISWSLDHLHTLQGLYSLDTLFKQKMNTNFFAFLFIFFWLPLVHSCMWIYWSTFIVHFTYTINIFSWYSCMWIYWSTLIVSFPDIHDRTITSFSMSKEFYLFKYEKSLNLSYDDVSWNIT